LQQSLAIHAIVAAASLPPNRNKPGVFKHSKVAGRSRPTVVESLREIARWQFAAQVAQEQQDVPPRLVRERREYGFGISPGWR
jgi:hypothetical protein